MITKTHNLYALRCLVTLVAESHVSRAADVMQVSQPAMSAMLGKLRIYFCDPILVKTEKGMVPTPWALDLAIRARAALDEVSNIFETSAEFIAATSKLNFKIITTESVAFIVIPKLASYLQVFAPYITISVLVPNPNYREELQEGKADIAIGYFNEVSPSLRVRQLRGRSLRVIASGQHPYIKKKLSLEQYADTSQIFYSPLITGGSSVERLVDSRLAALSLHRNISIKLPSVFAMSAVVAQSNLIATITKDVAEVLGPLFGLKVFEPPLELGAVDLSMYWDDRTHKNIACQWLRQIILEIAGTHHDQV